MSWQKESDELHRREAFAHQMGGPDKIKRQRDAGRLTVRERIDRLLDPDSFHETGAISGKAEYDADGNLVLAAAVLDDPSWIQVAQVIAAKDAPGSPVRDSPAAARRRAPVWGCRSTVTTWGQ